MGAALRHAARLPSPSQTFPSSFFISTHPPTKKAEVYPSLVPRYDGHTARRPSLRLWYRVSRQETMGRLQPMRGKSAFPGGGASRNRQC